jgi:hypothetical protein
MQQLYLLEEVARVLRLPAAEVASLIDAGELGGIRLPTGELRVAPSDLRIFLRARHLDLAPARESAA